MLKIFALFIFSFTSLLTFSTSASTSTQQVFFNSSATKYERNSAQSKNNDAQRLKKILTHYDEWEGVSYKFGGNSRNGIDCSAYMQRIFKDEFAFSLPRTSHEQIKLGSRIAKNDLNTGDLVFFKTSPRERHVGVYIGEGRFIHASTSVGVTVSNLDNKYWGKRYEQARRINHAEA